jgi:hypothetical protein
MRKNFVLTPLMIALVSGAAYTQDTSSAVLTGRVTTQVGNAPLAGVRVLIQSPSLLGQRQTVTGADGNFRVPLLPNGEYTVTYSLDGHLTRKLTMRLVAGQTANGSIRLVAVEVQETVVEIEAEQRQRIQADKTDTVVQTALSGDFLEKLGGRNINMIGQIAPGVSDSSLHYNFNIRGGTAASTKTLVNGVNTTEMLGGYRAASFDMPDLVESIAVIQSPLNARYGNTDGGIISVVTSKGTNEFKGTIRASMGRDITISGLGGGFGWGAADRGYLFREARNNQPEPEVYASGTDVLTKYYEVSITGPIWKDRVTFAYGAKVTPKTYTTRSASDFGSGSNPWAGGYSVNDPERRELLNIGIFYKHPTNLSLGYGNPGDEIRKAELHVRNTPDGRMTASYGDIYNQFAVYAQITPEHQLEYNYSDSNSLMANLYGSSWEADSAVNRQGTTTRAWNFVYKGIIGSSGVLDVRYGKNNQSWWFGDGKTFPIKSIAYQARFPKQGMPANQLDSYWQNSFFGRLVAPIWNELLGTGYLPLADEWIAANYPGEEPSTHFNDWLTYIGNPNRGAVYPWSGGPDDDIGDGGGITSFAFNYQHILSTGKGIHMIDVGMQSEKFNWMMKRSGAPYMFVAAGQVAKDLSSGDIYNPTGLAGNPSDYAGKYIVFNVPEARFEDVDAWTVNRLGIKPGTKFMTLNSATGMYELFPAGNIGLSNLNPDNGIPRMREYYGDEAGFFDSNMVSYYINDLWSINDNHSIQAGLRYDTLDSYDKSRKYVSYSMPTLRFEYKWDVHGDQSRLFNASWGQFHSWQPGFVFMPMATGRLSNTRWAYWSVGSATPYLVDRDELVNPANYKAVVNEQVAGSASYSMDDGWRAPTSTEFSLGLRRNLPNGGSWKITFSYRTSINQWDWYVDDPEPYIADDGTKQFKRVARNSDGYTRKYSGVELEWDYPVHKRVWFGGSYTFNRLMSNAPNNTESPNRYNGGDEMPDINVDAYWDSMFGSREAWAPVRLRNPEHYLKFFILLDFSSG